MFMPAPRHMGAAMAEFSPEELELVTRFMTAMVEATIAARQEASDGGPACPAHPPEHPPTNRPCERTTAGSSHSRLPRR